VKRFLIAAALGLVLTTGLQAHFIFVVPEPGGTKAKVVFSDDLEPDENVPIDKVGALKLHLRDAGGKDAPLTWSKGENCYVLDLAGSGTRVVHGSTNYGVMARKDAKPFLLRYHPKAVVGPWTGDAAKVGEAAPLEIVPVGTPGQLRLQVLAKGRPVADAEVTVMVPGDKGQKVKTDKDGLTPEFTRKGRYGAWARHFETGAGEHAGSKYEEVRHYATLVVDAGRSEDKSN
jgi:uncharacterized GH25 family protein